MHEPKLNDRIDTSEMDMSVIELDLGQIKSIASISGKMAKFKNGVTLPIFATAVVTIGGIDHVKLLVHDKHGNIYATDSCPQGEVETIYDQRM